MLRHKAELMYRASLNNRDRTTILMYNNPLPDVADSSQQDSISRYIPSWEEADQVTISSKHPNTDTTQTYMHLQDTCSCRCLVLHPSTQEKCHIFFHFLSTHYSICFIPTKACHVYITKVYSVVGPGKTCSRVHEVVDIFWGQS